MNTPLRIGTRGSDLALWQARDVAERLAQATGVSAELVIIKTQGDLEADMPMTPGVWATGAFVSAIEKALAAEEIDLAVHSYKDLATVSLPGLAIVATPPRAARHDVLVASGPETADTIHQALAGEGDAAHLRLGTSSPRRAAQLRRALRCAILPIRGNVATRLAIAQRGQADAICLAAAGIERLGLTPEFSIPLPIDRFPTAPAQGAMAVQAREGTRAAALCSSIDHEPTRRCTTAERAFLERVSAGCHAPIAASAALTPDGSTHLHVQLFNDRGDLFEESASGADARSLGLDLGQRALEWLRP